MIRTLRQTTVTDISVLPTLTCFASQSYTMWARTPCFTFFSCTRSKRALLTCSQTCLLSHRDLGAELLLQHPGGRILPDSRSFSSCTARTALQAHSQDYRMRPLFVARHICHVGHSVHLHRRSYASLADISCGEPHQFWERDVPRNEWHNIWHKRDD